MLLRTVITKFQASKTAKLQAELVSLGLAQNTEVLPDHKIVGDWVDPELLGMTHKTYLHRTLTLQHGVGCHAHVEVS